MNEKTAILFCPYFGRLPDNFELWLISAEYNKSIDFYIFTDDNRKWTLPENVRIINIPFSDFRNSIQNCFDFRISLNSYYKICDFRPAFGYIFRELAENYSFWGHFDLDVIWGNLEKFFPSDISRYGKINNAGHFSLYKNENAIITAFTKKVSKIDYRHILSSPTHYAFDEIGEYGINTILRKMGIEIFPYEETMARIDCHISNLSVGQAYNSIKNRTTKYDRSKMIFSFEDGHVFSYSVIDGIIIEKEWSYIHLQKRKMHNMVKDSKNSKFLICPHTYEDYHLPTKELIQEKRVSLIYPEDLKIRLSTGIRRLRREIAVHL